MNQFDFERKLKEIDDRDKEIHWRKYELERTRAISAKYLTEDQINDSNRHRYVYYDGALI